MIRLTYPFNALGWPALALPCGPAEDGLPASVQLAAPLGEDARVLAAGALLERALSGPAGSALRHDTYAVSSSYGTPRRSMTSVAKTRRSSRRRRPLSRDRVLHTAIALADERGVDELTMRKLAKELGVEAMSLYHHVANKTDLLDGMIDLVFSEIDAPSPGGDWKAELRKRAISTRAALAPAPLGDRRDGGADRPRAREPPPPRRRARMPASPPASPWR